MEIQPRLQTVFRDVFDDDDIVINAGTTADDILDWDSLAHVSLIVAIEREFSVRFSPAEVNDLPDVGALMRVIRQKVG